ncbi:Hypothetical protein PACV_161 [Pacmanvirus A23]|uniref:Hypothetical protein n=1 Tax=Pacmanvirus A23 TaxID=1932881 RepID=UPI000A095DEF|nr:Hypothetical protein B9W72_gp159 [Pacmanvirus A23]SIP85876.1 Hypothetical protein PACV_161 [Pacmanvirus A23]
MSSYVPVGGGGGTVIVRPPGKPKVDFKIIGFDKVFSAPHECPNENDRSPLYSPTHKGNMHRTFSG